ncbi:hypothetical protein DQ04_04821060 [Trypanosoma grayi]|uniref:hypothetical protein n=1 Tax=Trypanosoma grayi TaxID=71804 RepID=UPI0004F3F154|nr:hypothetical protein DQ04_04821060 [Trypanosoma grayi]KEG09682.1 hypothetical protein DQ04_04821060 [Trypanosoma grayi]
MTDSREKPEEPGPEVEVSPSGLCEGDAEDAGNGQNGFHDLVPTSLAELTANEEAHTTSHLVEGDFFPDDSPARVELGAAGERYNLAVGSVQGRELGHRFEHEQETPTGIGSSSSSGGSKEDACVESGDGVCPSRFPPARRVVKRVRWADEGAAPTTLLQQQSSTDSVRTGLTCPPPPVLREVKNTDGTAYLSCRALRPAQRFVLWKRRMSTANGGVREETPFRPQPHGAVSPTQDVTLLAALHPPYRAEHIGPAVRMRVAEIAESAKKGVALCDGGLQMPMVRASELRNVPLRIPF